VFKSNPRALLVAGLAITVIGAVASGAASAAPQWLINGTPFAGDEAISAKISVPGDLFNLISTLTGGVTRIVIGCTALEPIGGEIFGDRLDKATKLALTNCKVDTPGGCKVTEPVVALNLASEAVDLNGMAPVYTTFSPTPPGNGLFVKIFITGCSAEGVYNVGGKTVCEILTPTTQQVEKLCQFKEIRLLNSLKFGLQTARLEGTVVLSLTGPNKGKTWGVNP
jgi:hypothetical protein